MGKHNVCICTPWRKQPLLIDMTDSYNSGLAQIQSQFHVGQEVALLGLTLYLAGYHSLHQACFRMRK